MIYRFPQRHLQEYDVYVHYDCDGYFASVEEKYNPHLKDIPFVITGPREMRHSVVMSKNNVAKKAGVITGISFRQAKQICPSLTYIVADMKKYHEQTKLIRDVALKYSEKITPYGLDEAWLNLGNIPFKEAAQLAELIRIEVMYSLGLSASLGVSFNRIYSKIGSDYRKPNATTVITPDNYQEIVWPLPASHLLFVGEQRMEILKTVGIQTIGDIAQADPMLLGKLLGKVGVDLHRYANGNDNTFKPDSDINKSIGHTLTPPADLYSNSEVAAILYIIVTAVCGRLQKHGQKAWRVSLHMRDNSFNKIVRQCSFWVSTDNINYIFNHAYKLFIDNYTWAHPLRSLGLRVEGLDRMEQLALFPYDECELCVDVDSRLQRLTRRFGPLKVDEFAIA